MTFIAPLSAARGVERFGGKAHALARLLDRGLPVPRGFAVDVEAFRRHSRAAGAQGGNPRTELLEQAVDQSVAKEFHAAWGRYFKPGQAAAVRSSAVTEDSPDASFAGQFHTELHVASSADGLQALRRCWASCCTAHAASYGVLQRAFQGGPAQSGEALPAGQGMGVVVQEMVDVAFAGVAFTEEPVTGSDEVPYVEWVDGDGELLVSGERVGGRAWLDRAGRPLRMDHLGGDTPPADLWPRLGGLLEDVVLALGPRQDIEWALSTDGGLRLLQARPVAAGARSDRSREAVVRPWILPGRAAGGWTDEQRHFFDLWDEYNPSAVTPLEYDLFMRQVWAANLAMLDQGRGVPAIDAAVVRDDAVPLALEPAAPLEPVPPQAATEPLADLVPRWRAATDHLRRKAGNLSELGNQDLYDALCAAGRLHASTCSTRLMQMNEWIEGEAETAAEVSGFATSTGLAADDALGDLRGGVDHETARMNQALFRLARDAEARGMDAEWHVKFEGFLECFGHVGSGGEPARDALLASVRQTVRSGLGEDPVEVARQRARRVQEQIRERLPASGQVSFERAVTALRRWVALREDSKALEDLPVPLMRDAIREVSRRLRSVGALADDQAADLLQLDELREALVEGRAPAADLSQRAQRLEWKRGRSWLPLGFRGTECRPDQGRYQGLGASGGVAEGPVRGVASVDEFGGVSTGDIVVARATSPAWTLLFSRIAAIVVENGSRLSHAAVVAREYGLPAVVDLPGITGALRDGERIRVDGASGEVVRL